MYHACPLQQLERFSQVNARSAQAEIDGMMEYMELSSFNLSSLPSAFRSIDGLRMHSADTAAATTTTTTIIYDDDEDANASRERRRRRRKKRKGRSRNRTIEDLLMLNPNLDSLVSNEDDDDDDDEVGMMAAHEGEGLVKEYSYYHDDMMLNNSGPSQRNSINDGDNTSHHHQDNDHQQHHHHSRASIADISIANKRPFDDDEDEDPMGVSAAAALSTCLDDRKPDEHLLEDSDEKSCGSSYDNDDYDDDDDRGGEGGDRIAGRHLRIASITTDVSGLSYDRGYMDQSHTPPRPHSYMMAPHEHTHQHGGSRVLSHHHQHAHQPTSHYHPHHLQPHDYNHYHPSESSSSSSIYTQHPLAPIADDPFISISRGISFMSIFSNKQSSTSRGDQYQHTHRGVLSKGGSLPTWHT